MSDLTSLTLSDDLAHSYWSTQTPIRLIFLFALTGYSYLFKEDGPFASSGKKYTVNAGDQLKNSIIFTWGFLEMATWFWVSAPRRLWTCVQGFD